MREKEDRMVEIKRGEGRGGCTTMRSRSGELEGSRLLNQQKPHGGWFSDASSTSATESFPSYTHLPTLSLSLSLSLSLTLYLFICLYPATHCGLSVARVHDNDSKGNCETYSRGENVRARGWLRFTDCRVAKM